VASVTKKERFIKLALALKRSFLRIATKTGEKLFFLCQSCCGKVSLSAYVKHLWMSQGAYPGNIKPTPTL
jgi:hypothetical protein